MQDATIRAIEQFLYREARLLDSRQYHAWLDLLADDVRLLDAGAHQPLR